MKEELSLREIINEVILFFINFKILIIAITLVGSLGVVVFQKLRPAYYLTNAIATSGISEFERISDAREVMNQRTAINLINNLQIDVEKEDFSLLAKKLKISENQSEQLKKIEAIQIYREDQDGKKHNTPKFKILLSVRDNSIIPVIQNGLITYFIDNEYVANFYDKYQMTNQQEITAIINEVKELKELRNSSDSKVDMSTISILSKKGINEVQNNIVELIKMKSIINTNQELLKPLSFVQGFGQTQIPERGVLILGSLAFFISFIIAIVVSVFVNVKQKLIIK
tara:strand:- start:4691 stop:5542 length:852 start_codon:yes stop_codon:yes gene_type:complete